MAETQPSAFEQCRAAQRGDVPAADMAGRAQLNGKIVQLSFSPLVDCVLVSSAKPGQCSCVHHYCNPF